MIKLTSHTSHYSNRHESIMLSIMLFSNSQNFLPLKEPADFTPVFFMSRAPTWTPSLYGVRMLRRAFTWDLSLMGQVQWPRRRSEFA